MLFKTFFRNIFVLLETEWHRFLVSILAWNTMYLSDPSLYVKSRWADLILLTWGWSPSDPYKIHQTPISNHRDDLHQTPTLSIRPLLIHGEIWADLTLLTWGWSPSDPYQIHQTPICNDTDALHQTPTLSIRPLLIHGEVLGRLNFTIMGMISIRPLLDPSDPYL